MAKSDDIIIRIVGDTSQFAASLKALDVAAAKTGKELRTINSQLKFDPSNAQLLAQKMTVLDEKIDTTKKRLQTLTDAQSEVQRKFNSGQIGAEQMRAFEREIEKCKNQLKSLEAEKAGVQRLAQGFGNAAEEAKKAQAAIEASKKATQDLADYSKETVESIVSVGAKAIATITAAATAAAALSVKVGTSFEKAMSQVVATMGLDSTTEEYEKLSAAAKEMGATTKFTATEAAEALNYMALAGYDCAKQIEVLPIVLNAAAAGGMDLASASNMVTNSMTALGVGVENVQHFTDEMARTAQKSNTSFAELGEAIISIGGTAKMLTGGTHELNTLIGILGDNGIKASEAGVNLRQVMLNLIESADKMQKQFGVDLYDKATGNMRELADVFADLNAYMDGFNDRQKNEVLTGIFGDRTQRAARALMDGSVKRYQELYDIIGQCDGATKDMAKTMGDNLAGSVTIFKSGLEACGITIYEKFEQPLKEAVRRGIEEVTALNGSMTDGELSSSLDRLSKAFGELAEEMIDFAVNDAIPAVIKGFNFILKNGAELKALILAVGHAFVTWKVGTLISKTVAAVRLYTIAAKEASIAQAAFNATLAINPYVLAATAIVGLTVGLASLAISSATAKTEIEEMNSELEKAKQRAASSSESVETEIGLIEAQVEVYNDLKTEYEKTGESAEKLKDVAENLQKALGDSVSVIDEETGAYNDLTASVESLIAAKRKQQEYDSKTSYAEEAIAQAAELEKELEESVQREYEFAQESLGNKDSFEDYKQYLIDSNVIGTGDLVDAINERKAIISEYQDWLKNSYSETASETSQSMAESEIAASLFAESLQDVSTSMDGYKESVSDSVSASKDLTSALEEQAKSGSLSSETVLKLIDNGYALCLELDKETGLYTLNRDKVAALTAEKYAKIKADMMEKSINLKEKYDEEREAVEKLRDGISSLAEAREYETRVAALRESDDALAQLEAYSKTLDQSLTAVKDYKYTPTDQKTTKTEKTDTADYWKQEAETQLSALKHQYSMGLIAADDYYKQLDALNRKYFAGREQYLDEYRQYELEVYNGLKTAYNAHFDADKQSLDHLLAMNVIDADAYYAQLEELVNRYYKDKQDYADEYRKYEEMLYSASISSHKRRLQEQKEAIEKSNDAQEKEIDLIRAKQELLNAKNNKTVKVYSEAAGFHWESNAADVAKAEENVKKLLVDKEVDAIDRLIAALDNVRNTSYTDPTTGVTSKNAYYGDLPEAEYAAVYDKIAGIGNLNKLVENTLKIAAANISIPKPSEIRAAQATSAAPQKHEITYNSHITVDGTADAATRQKIEEAVKQEVDKILRDFVDDFSAKSTLM
jgi:TP901 family phage tail tape measure protein